MRTNLYTIYDVIAEIFNKPFTAFNDADAIRSFIKGVKENNFADKNDFALYAIGEWNDSSGTIMAYDIPKKIYTGIDIKVGKSISLEQQQEDLQKIEE